MERRIDSSSESVDDGHRYTNKTGYALCTFSCDTFSDTLNETKAQLCKCVEVHHCWPTDWGL